MSYRFFCSLKSFKLHEIGVNFLCLYLIKWKSGLFLSENLTHAYTMLQPQTFAYVKKEIRVEPSQPLINPLLCATTGRSQPPSIYVYPQPARYGLRHEATKWKLDLDGILPFARHFPRQHGYAWIQRTGAWNPIFISTLMPTTITVLCKFVYHYLSVNLAQ